MFTIEGYADTVSVPQGGQIGLHVSTTAKKFDIEIYREGFESRLIARIEGLAGQSFPIPAHADEKGCGWPQAYALNIEPDWPSGAYRARLVAYSDPQEGGMLCLPEGWGPSFPTTQRFVHEVKHPKADYTDWCEQTVEHQVFFIVRAAQPGKTSPILLQLCTNTYAAYNPWGGHSIYDYHSLDEVSIPRVSLDRPGMGYYGDTRYTMWELPFVKWAEANGIPLEYASNCDLERVPGLLDNYKLVLSVGHDEYWSAPMRRNLEAHIAKGGNAAIFSGNSICWQIRLEDDGRVIVCYQNEEDPVRATDPKATTTAYSSALIGWPSNTVIGVGWNQAGYHRSHGIYMDGSGAYTVKRPDHWVFDGTGLKAGDEFGGANTIVGYETDGCLFETGPDGLPYPTGADGTPKDFLILAQAPAGRMIGSRGMATMGLYTHGGTMFNAATTDWAHGLASDPIVQRITRNVLERLSGEKFG